MANEMVERVARAICTAQGGSPKVVAMVDGTNVKKSRVSAWEAYVPVARAAIEAMREPTDEMLEHAHETVRPDSDNAQCPDFYRAAIDAALKE